MTYKNYTIFFVITAFLISAAAFLIEWLYFNFEPYSGDLTRIGSYSERDYGNNNVESYFNPILSKKGVLSDIENYDVIVIGDSFSKNRFNSMWHNYLQKDTGLNIGVFDIKSLDSVSSRLKHSHSPKIIIYESVERALNSRHNKSFAADTCKSLPTKHLELNFKLNPSEVDLSSSRRSTGFYLNIGRSIRYMISLLNHKKESSSLKLSTNKLFSNNKSDQLLIFNEDIDNKKNMSLLDWQSVRCNLLTLQNKIQQNKNLVFLTLVAPDKLTTYSPYLLNTELGSISQYQSLMKDTRLNIIPILSYFRVALNNNNEQDIYLPNDTHWGASGNKIVGIAVLNYLKKYNLIIN